MPSDLHSCFTTLCSSINAAFRETAEPAGHVQEAPDGLFHAMFAQLDTITGMPLDPTNVEAGICVCRYSVAIPTCFCFRI
jgi:hypothetical protein